MKFVEIKFQLSDNIVEYASTNLDVQTGHVVIVNTRKGSRTAFVVNENVEYDDAIKPIGMIAGIKEIGRNDLTRKIKRYAYDNNFKLNDWAFDKYKGLTLGNKDADRKQAELKLNRNIILGTKLKVVREDGVVRFDYGHLRIYVNLKSNEIVSVSNHNKPPQFWFKDEFKYGKLNCFMGIKS